MTELNYDLSLQGTAEQRRSFAEQVEVCFPGAYSAPDYSNPHIVTLTKEVGTRRTAKQYKESLISWVRDWSHAYPAAIVRFYLEQPPTYKAPGEIYFGSGLNNANLMGGKIDSHRALHNMFPAKRCYCERPYFNTPDKAPYADCPARLNPTTAWAVQEFYDVSENLVYKERNRV